MSTPKSVGIPAAADYLGVSKDSIRRRIAEGRLPAYRVGPKLIRIRIEDLDALMRPIGGAVND